LDIPEDKDLLGNFNETIQDKTTKGGIRESKAKQFLLEDKTKGGTIGLI